MSTVTPDGQLLLIRMERVSRARGFVHQYSPQKRVVLVELELKMGRGGGGGNDDDDDDDDDNHAVEPVVDPVIVVGRKRRMLVTSLHLTSDYRAAPGCTRASERGAQLMAVMRFAQSLTGDPASALDVVLVGDMNCASESEDQDYYNLPHSAIDVWRHTHSTKPGYTYDPSNNPLALLNSPPGKGSVSKRCDRIIVYSMPDHTQVFAFPDKMLVRFRY